MTQKYTPKMAILDGLEHFLRLYRDWPALDRKQRHFATCGFPWSLTDWFVPAWLTPAFRRGLSRELEKLEREGVLRRVSAGVSDRVTHIQPTTAYVAEIMAEADEQTAAEYRTTLGLATWGQQILRELQECES